MIQTKLVWHFSEFSTIFYTFLKFIDLNLGKGLEICRQNPRKIKIRAIGSLLIGEEGAGGSPAKFQRGVVPRVEKERPASTRSSRRTC
jgi:hypothetical protein